MATASIPGFRASLFFASSSAGGDPTSSGTVLVRFGELADFTLSVAQGVLDATSKDSAGWKEHLNGLREWGGSGTGLYLLESSDIGQVAVWNVIAGQQDAYVTLREAASSAATTPMQQYKGVSLVTAFDIESPLDGPAKVKLSIKGTGPLTRAAATS